MSRPGRKSAAQTPAPKSEKIYGSKKNKPGSASSSKSAKSIKLSASIIKSLQEKLNEFHKNHKKAITLNDLKAVYRRGLGAYSSSHRPTITGGVPNTRNAWAMARVNKFLKKAGGEQVKAAYVQDDDLMAEGGAIEDFFKKGGTLKAVGDCYETACLFTSPFLSPKKDIQYVGTPYLVQAEVQGQGAISHIRYGHSWIEDDENVYDFSNGRELILPKALYYHLGDVKTDNPKKYKKYTFSEARRKMIETGHYGSWELDVEYETGGEIINVEGKQGECFKNVQDYLLMNELPNAVIIHGHVNTSRGVINHAWIMDGDMVIDPTTGIKVPKERYYEKLTPTEDSEYTFTEALQLRFNTKNYGPWTTDEFAEGGEIPNDLRELQYFEGAYKGAEWYSMGNDKEYEKMADRWYDLMLKHQGGNKLNKKEFEEFKKLSSILYRSDEFAEGGETDGEKRETRMINREAYKNFKSTIMKSPEDIVCVNCLWEWEWKDTKPSDRFVCHRCGFDNTPFYTVFKETMSLEDIAKKHNVDMDYLQNQFEIGTKHETDEHTKKGTKLAKEVGETIALHHLEEMPDYYERIKDIENKTDNEKKPSHSLIEFENFEEPEVEYVKYSVWYPGKNTEAEAYDFYELSEAVNHIRRSGKNGVIRDFEGRKVIKNDDLHKVLKGEKRYYEFEDGGDIAESEPKSEYEIPDFLEEQKEEADAILFSRRTMIAKFMICNAYIEMAEEKIEEAETALLKNVWQQVKYIWETTKDEVDDVIYMYEEGGEAGGCGCTKRMAKGGLAYGNSHDKGGMPMKVKSTGQNIEIEGGEGVINKRSMQMTKRVEFEGQKLTPCEVISKINEMGGGVKFNCNDVKEIIEKDGDF